MRESTRVRTFSRQKRDQTGRARPKQDRAAEQQRKAKHAARTVALAERERRRALCRVADCLNQNGGRYRPRCLSCYRANPGNNARLPGGYGYKDWMVSQGHVPLIVDPVAQRPAYTSRIPPAHPASSSSITPASPTTTTTAAPPPVVSSPSAPLTGRRVFRASLYKDPYSCPPEAKQLQSAGIPSAYGIHTHNHTHVHDESEFGYESDHDYGIRNTSQRDDDFYDYDCDVWSD